jgi:hypothetical protein
MREEKKEESFISRPTAKAFPRFCVLPSAGLKDFPDNRFGLEIANPKPDCAEYCWQLEFLTAVNCLV